MERFFKWRAGIIHPPVEAEFAANAIKDISTSLGRESITAKELVDASRDNTAPLHCCFEWDDSIAAERFRQNQACIILNGIEITIRAETKETNTRVFVNTQAKAPGRQGEYTPFEVVLKNPELREVVLRNALNELRSFQRKYSTYKELSTVNNAINKFADSLK